MVKRQAKYKYWKIFLNLSSWWIARGKDNPSEHSSRDCDTTYTKNQMQLRYLILKFKS